MVTAVTTRPRACKAGVPMRNRRVCMALSHSESCQTCGKLTPSPPCYGTFHTSTVCALDCLVRKACRRERAVPQPDGQILVTDGKDRVFYLATPLAVALSADPYAWHRHKVTAQNYAYELEVNQAGH